MEIHNEQERIRIGQRITELRAAKGMTQAALADACGLGRSHIVRIEKGMYNIQLETLALIAGAFGMTIDFVKK